MISAPPQKLSDTQLLQETQRLVETERRITLDVLHHLAEVERRSLFASEGYSSLFAFCIDRLKYSEMEAQRRISAMRLLQQVPEAEAQVNSGELKLSQLAQVQTFIRAEKNLAGRTVSKEETSILLAQIAGLSTRESDRTLLAISPALQERRRMEERLRPVTATLTEVKFSADAELVGLMEEAKALFAHSADMNPALNALFKEGLKLLVHQKKKTRTAPASSFRTTAPSSSSSFSAPAPTSSSPPSTPPTCRATSTTASSIGGVAPTVPVHADRSATRGFHARSAPMRVHHAFLGDAVRLEPR